MHPSSPDTQKTDEAIYLDDILSKNRQGINLEAIQDAEQPSTVQYQPIFLCILKN